MKAPRAARQALVATLVVAALAAVFVSWRNPHLMVELANQLWSCV